jgi:hypothetical protein
LKGEVETKKERNSMKEKTEAVSFEECLKLVLTGQRECLHAPEEPVEPGEEVLGILENPVARAMYSLWREMEEGGQKFNKTIPERPPERPGEILALQSQAHQFRNRIKCAHELFWELVYSDFPKARDPRVTIGIRENWTVVIFKASRGISILDLIG